MSSSSSSTMRQFTPTPKEIMPRLEIEARLGEALAECYSDIVDGLEDMCIFETLEGEAQKKYGDYAFYGVVVICDSLREADSHLFTHTTPSDIAKKIKSKFETLNKDMVKEVFLQNAGIFTFRLQGRWIAERIYKMLNDGISTWAPTIHGMKSGERLVFVFPTSTIPITTDMNADMVRAVYMKEALADMFIYSGVDAVSGSYDDSAMIMARNQFTEKQGEIVSEGQQKPLFTLNGSSNDNVYMDLATLWYGINTQEAHMMVYMTPHRLRGYIQQCHIAAADAGWLPNNWKDICKVMTCGFQTISGEQKSVTGLWFAFLSWSQHLGRHKLWYDAGYSLKAFFECAFKFAWLKRERLAECIFNYEDIVDKEGNMFLSLLETQTLVCSLLKNSPDRNLFKLNELVGKQRELGLHIVQFTEVIEVACEDFMPQLVCEYLCNLSKLFMCYYSEVFIFQTRHDENTLGLCKATEVVMKKCFHLLGIAPSLGVWSKEFQSYVYRKEETEFTSSVHKEARATNYHIIPLYEDARKYLIRNEYLKSRFEFFSMSVRVTHSAFTKGNIFGFVSVVDTCRFANGWPVLDLNDDVHVPYFDHEWYDPVCILNGSNISFGNPGSVHSIPFSSSIAVKVKVKATSKNNDQTYLLCNRDASSDLSQFWKEDSNTKFGTMKFNSEDGCIKLYFVAIKDAIDTKMKLTFHSHSSRKAVRLSGYISASYGDEVLNKCGFLGQYKAIVFKPDPTKMIGVGKTHLMLHKSTLAVPAKGYFEIEACLLDADTQRLIVNETKKFCESESLDGVSTWDIPCEKGSFEFRVEWVR